MEGLIFLVILLAIVLVMIYNGIVQANIKCDESWSTITVQLKRRYDLIPNLINTVKGYKDYESGILSKVTELRSSAINAGDSASHEKMVAESELSKTVKSIFALAENYPDLKANTSFIHLQEELSDTEDQIAASRRFYNSNVTNLNTKIETFPSNLVANMFNFKKREFFNAQDENIDKVVEVKF